MIFQIMPELAEYVSISHESVSENLKIYADLLLQWSKSINLTGVSSRKKIYADLIADSFYLANFLDGLLPADFKGNIWDFGSGAGLPGIPLRIIWQKGIYTMIEAREKRAIFLANVLARLQLPNTSVFRGTVQDFIKGKKASAIISRAFMPFEKVLKISEPFLEENANVIIMANSEPGIIPAGWKLSSSLSYPSLNKKRWLWAFSKQLPRQ